MSVPERPAVHKTVCSHDCPDACSVLVTVENGKAVRFAGAPDHPVTRGFLCGKVGAYKETVYHPDRVLQPLRRVGAKGEGRFERISWDDALDEVAGAIAAARAEHGGESLLLYFYAGTMGQVGRFSAEALFHRLGATQLRQNICYNGADAGWVAVTGGGYGVDIEDVPRADFVTVWGANIATTQVHLVPLIDEARARGAPLWVIDPYRNRTARMAAGPADRWLAVRPGGDAALALGVMHVLERDGLVDRDFIERRTVGYERLRDDVLPRFEPARAGALSRVDAEVIEEYAKQLASAEAPLFKVGIGLGRSAVGGAAVRAVACLAGALGAYEKVGGGVQYDAGCEHRFNLDPVRRPDWLERPTRTMNMTELARALTEWDDPPAKFLYVHGSNPLATAPRQDAMRAGMRREDLFTVVHERFLTDTARHADIVLPAVTFVESSDLYKSYGHLHFQFGRQVLPPAGECRTNLGTVQAIGRRLGFDDPWFHQSEEELVREVLAQSTHPNFAGVDPDRVLAGETTRLALPRGESGFRERFPTPSGKLEFYSETLAAQGLPGVVDTTDVASSAEYPLRLITPPAHSFIGGTFGHRDAARKRERSEPHVLVNPADAEAITTGCLVELRSPEGAVRLRARVTDDTRRGTVVAESVWWPLHSPGGCGINALASDALGDLGEGSVFHGIPVALREVEEET